MTVEAMERMALSGAATSASASTPGDAAAPAGKLAALLGEGGGWREAAFRCGAGLGMSGVFGLALGARDGGIGLAAHALGVAAAPAGVLLFGVPALYIVLALFDAPIDAVGMARCASRGTAALGIVLSGLSPLTALYVVSAEVSLWGALVGGLAAMLGGIVALSHFHAALRRQVESASIAVRSSVLFASWIFGLLATVGAARIWCGLVPTFGGGL